MTGYPDKTPSSKPPIESVAGYAKDKAPAAAKYGVGAKSVAEIAEAAEARRQHGRDILNRPVGPQRLANKDSKR
jgi:hypothetical protein